jgi:hypothetical protein
MRALQADKTHAVVSAREGTPDGAVEAGSERLLMAAQ